MHSESKAQRNTEHKMYDIDDEAQLDTADFEKPRKAGSQILIHAAQQSSSIYQHQSQGASRRAQAHDYDKKDQHRKKPNRRQGRGGDGVFTNFI